MESFRKQNAYSNSQFTLDHQSHERINIFANMKIKYETKLKVDEFLKSILKY